MVPSLTPTTSNSPKMGIHIQTSDVTFRQITRTAWWRDVRDVVGFVIYFEVISKPRIIIAIVGP